MTEQQPGALVSEIQDKGSPENEDDNTTNRNNKEDEAALEKERQDKAEQRKIFLYRLFLVFAVIVIAVTAIYYVAKFIGYIYYKVNTEFSQISVPATTTAYVGTQIPGAMNAPGPVDSNANILAIPVVQTTNPVTLSSQNNYSSQYDEQGPQAVQTNIRKVIIREQPDSNQY